MMATMCVRPSIRPLPNRRSLPVRNQTRLLSCSFGTKKNVLCKSHSTNKWALRSSGTGDELRPLPVSSSDHAIVHFYDHINSKNLKKIEEFISNDCCFEDYSFLEPFTGKKEVMQFLKELTECMGKNVKFVIQNVCQGDQFSVAIIWCLEWKGKSIPFTRGCTFYEFSEEDGRLIITRARIMTEWPIKPGSLVLALLKLVMYLFDNFPRATEKFLQKPRLILEFLLRFYNLFLAPFIQPILLWYIIIWKFLVQLFLNTLSVLIHMSRIFSNKRDE